MYGPPGTGPEASGGLRRSKIGVFGVPGCPGGVRGPILGLPYLAPVVPLGKIGSYEPLWTSEWTSYLVNLNCATLAHP